VKRFIVLVSIMFFYACNSNKNNLGINESPEEHQKRVERHQELKQQHDTIIKKAMELDEKYISRLLKKSLFETFSSKVIV